MSITYEELMTARPDDFRACGRQLATVTRALAAAEHTFSTSIATPLGTFSDWACDAAAHALLTAQAHQHALSTGRQEMAAAAEAVNLYADDLARLQQAITQAVSTAQFASVYVHPDGSTEIHTATYTAGAPSTIDPEAMKRALKAEDTFKNQRNAVLRELAALDDGCADILGKIAGGVSQIYVDQTNELPQIDFNGDPPGLAEVQLALAVGPDDGTGKSPQERLDDTLARLSTLLQGHEVARESVKNLVEQLQHSPDAGVRDTADRFKALLGKNKIVAADLGEFGERNLPALEFLLNAAEFSKEGDDSFEVVTKSAVKTAVTTVSVLAGAQAGAELGGPPCAATGPAAPVCEGVAIAIGALAGAWLGGKAGDTLTEGSFDVNGLPDPFLVKYKPS